ncbi:MAG: type II toxin-antitoxin system VapC family toxin [Campylobacterota bacterium]|nr:type II toxin-antitoxin system VapC family toxin [Campylobacterota bacterium]
MKYLLDTNIISEFISKIPNKRVIDYILTLDENDLYLSVITIGEIKAGIEKLDSGSKKEKLLHWLENDLLNRFQDKIVDIDTEVMLQWGTTNNRLKQLGKPLPIMDSLIGATSEIKDFILITRNEKDFKNLNIKVVNPFL